MTLRKIATLLGLGAASLLSGCTESLPPATTSVASLPAPPPGLTSVVFVRPRSTCDRSEYTVIVEANGEFVANVAAGTQVSVPAAPGRHTYFAWSSVDTLIEREPNWNPVGALRVNAEANDTSYVDLALGAPCGEYTLVELRQVSPRGPIGRELADSLASTRPAVSDRAAGQLALDAKPAHKATYLELGAAKLARLEDQRARRERHDALLAEDLQTQRE